MVSPKLHSHLRGKTWLSCALFRLTESLDYYGVFLAIMLNSFLAWYRFTKFNAIILGVPFVVISINHLRYMTFTLFDYGWHVKICAVAAVIQAVAWISWSIINSSRFGDPPRMIRKSIFSTSSVNIQIISLVYYWTPVVAVDVSAIGDLRLSTSVSAL